MKCKINLHSSYLENINENFTNQLYTHKQWDMATVPKYVHIYSNCNRLQMQSLITMETTM